MTVPTSGEEDPKGTALSGTVVLGPCLARLVPEGGAVGELEAPSNADAGGIVEPANRGVEMEPSGPAIGDD